MVPTGQGMALGGPCRTGDGPGWPYRTGNGPAWPLQDSRDRDRTAGTGIQTGMDAKCGEVVEEEQGEIPEES